MLVERAQALGHDPRGLAIVASHRCRGAGRERLSSWLAALPARDGRLFRGRGIGEKLPQVVGKILGDRVAFGEALGQGLQTNALHFLGNRVVPLPGRTGLLAGDLIQQRGRRVGGERPPAGEQLVQHHAQAENVAAAIDPMPFATRLLGAHVVGRARVAWSAAHVLLAQREAEIGDERLAALVQQDIARLDIAMHQPPAMRVVQGFSDCGNQLRALLERRPRLLEPRGETWAVDELRNHKTQERIGAADVVHRHDMWMVEAGDGAGFGQIVVGILGAGHQAAMRHLDCHQPFQLIVAGEINESEASLPQQLFDAIAADLRWHVVGYDRRIFRRGGHNRSGSVHAIEFKSGIRART